MVMIWQLFFVNTTYFSTGGKVTCGVWMTYSIVNKKPLLLDSNVTVDRNVLNGRSHIDLFKIY